MSEQLTVDICVIGAGSGGLTVASGASQLGASVVLIERGLMGGDCLNFGCVPSKSLIASALAAQGIREAGRFGVEGGRPKADFARVHDHVRGVIAAIAPNDSVARFEGLGVRVIQAPGRFVGPREVEAGETRVRARRFVVATGSSPAVPPIPGLAETPYFTNETIFANKLRLDHLVVLGGGPVGVELAQAFRRLGAEVTIIEMLSILAREDPEAVGVVRVQLVRDGVDIVDGARVNRVEKRGKGVELTVVRGGAEERIRGSHLLVAAGRQANVDGLDLEEAGIAYSAQGIEVDARLRTSNRRVYAIGDVIGGPQFTHLAAYHAGIVIRNALFRLPAKADLRAIPRVIYTEPELAQVGLTDVEAVDAGERVRVLRWAFHENDRAQAEHTTDGFVKAVCNPRGRVLGATIAGPRAGELIQPWILAVGGKVKLGDIASMVAPYPTLGEVSKRAAGSFYMPRLFNARVRRLVRFLGSFG